MSTDFGFRATEEQDYYFISYNTEDADRVGEICRLLNEAGLPIWYDEGIPIDSYWESILAERIDHCKEAIFFITKGIFKKAQYKKTKNDIFTYREYDLARRYKKKILIVLLDEIEDSIVPHSLMTWWQEIDPGVRQGVIAYNHNPDMTRDIILNALSQNANIDNAYSSCDWDIKNQRVFQIEKNDYSELSIESLKYKSDKGDPIALFELSERYRNGDGVIENEAEFFRLLRKSAEAGYDDAINRMGYCYEYGLATKPDISKAVEFYREAVLKGNKKGQFNLGRLYRTGKGVEKNIDEAVRLYKLSADQGNSNAQRVLGVLYEFGDGVQLDLEKAVALYKLSAEKGDANAMCNLGSLYETGKGVEQNYEKAKEYYEGSADKGLARAQYKLGILYEYGYLGEIKIEKALELYSKAADQDYTKALVRLGDLYSDGTTVAKDTGLAVKYYERACEKDDDGALFRLALMYANGNGVEQDYEKAASLYKKSSELGNSGASNNLGILYENGNGVGRNLTEAVRYYSIAADAGNAFAKYNLAKMYERGDGIEADQGKAAALYAEMLEAVNDSDAQLNLGECYYHGKGVCRDWEKAFNLFLQSANAGNGKAQSWVADCYQYGEGTDADILQAEYWYKKAIEQDYVSAELRLGRLYKRGERYSEAANMFEKANEHGVKGADYELGLCYSLGKGVAKDDVRALELFESAASDNDKEALMKLGQAYQYGKGTAIDIEKAFSFYNIAAELGSEEARKILEDRNRLLQMKKNICSLKESNVHAFRTEADQLFDGEYAEMLTDLQLQEIIEELKKKEMELRNDAIRSGAARYNPDYDAGAKELNELTERIKKKRFQY